MPRPCLIALDFIVVNIVSQQPVAAFMLPGDAVGYIRMVRQKDGRPHGPQYDIVNADGSQPSVRLAEQARVANYIGPAA